VTENTDFDMDEIITAIADEPLLAGLSGPVQARFAAIVGKLAEGQRQMNLTAIRDPRAMVRYHIADSVALLYAVNEFGGGETPARAADVGTGGGFPLLPMAVVWPETEWVGIESVGKKAAFVGRTANELGLHKVSVRAERAEDVGRGAERESFDLATSRAVGPVASLLEVEMPLLKTGGKLYLFKTVAAKGEWNACLDFLGKLGGRPLGEYGYGLKGDEQQRLVFVAEKVKETPAEYPRAAGVPFKKPAVKLPEMGRR